MRTLLILASLLTGCATGESDRAALKAELKHEILAELREPSPEGPAGPAPTGHVEGRIHFRKEGVVGCQVKLVRLLDSSSFLGMFNEVRQGVEFHAVSDVDGRFTFPDVPCGSYRLLWQPPGNSGWIRRLREKPDAQVEAGQTSRMGDIDLSQKPVGTATP
ncbi:MAG TPA: carboxypeptidase-like regulatory domain-containing protein [Planctomycetota bacterium]|nr:carboxypeptidase-like regulatory domain-containing protein [Planctomycetota bacterium]